MEFFKQWTIFVCMTVLMCVVFSFLTPKGSMGRFYKMIISLFIFLSFLYPFSQSKINFDLPEIETANTYSINDEMIEKTEMETVISAGTPKRGGDGESPLPVEWIGRSLRSLGPNTYSQ